MSDPIEVEVAYISHCDHPNCGLGKAEYDCPVCLKHVLDYGDGWFGVDEPIFKCAECDATLRRKW